MSLTFLSPSNSNRTIRKTDTLSSLSSIKSVTNKTVNSVPLSPLSQTSITSLNVNDQDKPKIDFKTLFLESKDYNRFLQQVKYDLSQITEVNDEIAQFNIFYKYATVLYETIKKEWFWISNNEINRLFYYNDDQENHTKNFTENFELLKDIAYKYNYKKNNQSKILYQ